ncbi:MAG TPA: RagB/SusD family nutrient uptake outer membrane protein [Mucilaginibacter sp.]
MKKLYIYMLAATVVMASCKKDFLDQKPPAALPVGESIKTATDLNEAVNGMYASMSAVNFFGRDVPVLGDLLADNIYISYNNSGRYQSENNYTFTATNGEANDIFSQGYFSILQANRIIAANVPTSNDVKQLKGEAYAARAICYLTLINLFAKPYTVDPNADGVPLVTAPTTPSTAFAKPARAKVSEVYAKIISDLDSAFMLMPEAGTSLHNTNSYYIAKHAVKAIEARAYLYKGDYENAKAAALDVVNNGGYTLASADNLAAYWANPSGTSNGTETILELALTTANNNNFDGLDYFYSQDGYGDALVTQDLYDDYSATDARKGLIYEGDHLGDPALVNNKYSNVTNPNDKDDLKLFRYAEVLLTLSESYARTGDRPNALLYLNKLAKQRDPAFAGYTSGGDQLISDILNERRKELAFEGVRFFDFTRLNLPIHRPQQPDSAPSIENIPVGFAKRILPIPQAEIDANPNEKQNPGY